jgi:hypothetical protein
MCEALAVNECFGRLDEKIRSRDMNQAALPGLLRAFKTITRPYGCGRIQSQLRLTQHSSPRYQLFEFLTSNTLYLKALETAS